jgi:hypothetical protein
MPRPHVEFIQSQRIAWRPHTEGLLAGTDSRELSADPLTGARLAADRCKQSGIEIDSAPSTPD